MSKDQPVLVVTADEKFFAGVRAALRGKTHKDIIRFHPEEARQFIEENDHVILDMSGLQSVKHPALTAADGVWKRVLVVGAGPNPFVFHRAAPFRAEGLDSIERVLQNFLRTGLR